MKKIDNYHFLTNLAGVVRRVLEEFMSIHKEEFRSTEKGDKGDNGDKGENGSDGQGIDHITFTSTTDPLGRQGISGYKDTYSIYADNTDNLLLGYFIIHNGRDGLVDESGVCRVENSMEVNGNFDLKGLWAYLQVEELNTTADWFSGNCYDNNSKPFEIGGLRFGDSDIFGEYPIRLTYKKADDSWFITQGGEDTKILAIADSVFTGNGVAVFDEDTKTITSLMGTADQILSVKHNVSGVEFRNLRGNEVLTALDTEQIAKSGEIVIPNGKTAVKTTYIIKSPYYDGTPADYSTITEIPEVNIDPLNSHNGLVTPETINQISDIDIRIDHLEEDFNGDIDDIKHTIDAMKGLGGALPAVDIGADSFEQEYITQYACVSIWGDDDQAVFTWDEDDPAASTYEVHGHTHLASEIFNSTWVKNEFNGHRIVLTNTQNTDPKIFIWTDAGIDIVGVATETLAGIVKPDNETISVDTDGTIKSEVIRQYASFNDFPDATTLNEPEKLLFVDTDANKTYIWNGSEYISVGGGSSGSGTTDNGSIEIVVDGGSISGGQITNTARMVKLSTDPNRRYFYVMYRGNPEYRYYLYEAEPVFMSNGMLYDITPKTWDGSGNFDSGIFATIGDDPGNGLSAIDNSVMTDYGFSMLRGFMAEYVMKDNTPVSSGGGGNINVNNGDFIFACLEAPNTAIVFGQVYQGLELALCATALTNSIAIFSPQISVGDNVETAVGASQWIAMCAGGAVAGLNTAGLFKRIA